MKIVFDLDNTLACNKHRQHHITGDGPKDWTAFFDACHLDQPLAPAIAVYHALRSWHGGRHIIEIWSARSEGPDKVWRTMTLEWLEQYVEPFIRHNTIDSMFHTDTGYHNFIPLRMRAHKDHLDDHLLKRSWLHEAQRQGRPPDLVFDDRDRLVQMWRDEGIPCFQVQPGAF